MGAAAAGARHAAGDVVASWLPHHGRRRHAVFHPRRLWLRPRVRRFHLGPRPEERADARALWRTERDRLVARTMTAADSWLERHHDKPFFLYVDTWDPHEPWDPPDYYSKLYRPDFQGPALYPAYAKWKDAGL